MLLLLFWVAGFILFWDFLTFFFPHSCLLSASAATEKAQRPPQSRGQPRGSPQTFPPHPAPPLVAAGGGRGARACCPLPVRAGPRAAGKGHGGAGSRGSQSSRPPLGALPGRRYQEIVITLCWFVFSRFVLVCFLGGGNAAFHSPWSHQESKKKKKNTAVYLKKKA